MAIQACVFWSFTVSAATLQRARAHFAPVLCEALGELPFGYDLLPGETADSFIFATYQNLAAAKVSSLIQPVLERAYRFGNGWKIYNLDQLPAKKLSTNILGTWDGSAPATSALRAMMFAVSPETVVRREKPGVWRLV